MSEAHPVVPAAPQPAPTDGDDWQRLHPLSPLLRGGLVVLAVLGYAASQLFDRVLSSVGLNVGVPGVGGGDGTGDVGDPTGALFAHPLIALLLVLLVIAAIAGGNYVAWRFSRFKVGPRQVELRQGVLFRQHRQVPFERVQAVELSRPILARLLGLAQVVVQSAGGSDSNLRLSFLSLGRAERVRDDLLALAGASDEASTPTGMPGGAPTDGGAPPGGGPAWAAPRAAGVGQPLLEVPNGRLFVATILHGSTIVLAVLLIAALAGAGFAQFGVIVFAGLPALVPIAFGVGVGRVKELLTHGNFHLAETGTGLRIQHGLTDLRTTTIPIHRIQALDLIQPLWWRPLGWWRIRVNVAGIASGADGDGESETTLLPVGSLEDALHVISRLGHGSGVEVLRAAALGRKPAPGWQSVSPRARVFDPLSWRRNAWTLTDSAVVLRSGRLTRRAVTVPHARVQSMTLQQGPIAARMGLASVIVVSTPGPVEATLAHLDVDAAHQFLEVVSGAARVARRAVSTLPDDPHLAPNASELVD
ncbi:MAG: PH domain-containing protein [Ornithinibacter sp.]